MTSDAIRPVRHAVLCGISEYPQPYLSLPAVLEELEELKVLLQKGLHEDFRYDEVIVHKNDELTTTGIEQVFNRLNDQPHIDELFLYFAGIGEVWNSLGYYVTHNAPSSPPGFPVNGLAALWTRLQCRKIIVVLDFCYAGKTIVPQITMPDCAHIAVLTACRSDEVAASGSGMSRSFTGHFILAMRTSRGADDGIVRWGDVVTTACAAMERSTHQRPVHQTGERFSGHPINKVEVPQFPQEIETSLKAVDEKILTQYLRHVIASFTLLDLRGLSGTQQSIEIPLDHVYVDLQAESDNPTERDYDRRLIELDIRAYMDENGLDVTDETEVEEATYRVLSRDAYALQISQSGNRDVQGQPIPRKGSVVPLAEVIRTERRSIVLGDPGCGKTTLLRYCALHFAKAMLAGKPRVQVAAASPEHAGRAETERIVEDLGPTRLPIYIRIAAFAEARKQDAELRIIDFLPRYWKGEQLQIDEEKLAGLFRRHLKAGTALLLFDGLDEVTKLHERREIIRQIEQFVDASVPHIFAATGEEPHGRPRSGDLSPGDVGGNQVLLTSRIAGYRIAPFRESLRHYTVRDMSRNAISSFLRRWCMAIEERQGEERSQGEKVARAEQQHLQLLDAISSPRIRRLAVNPLLLTLLALLNRSLGRLPRLRIEIYRNVTRTLVETWRDSTLTEDEVLDILGPVALQIHTNIHTGLATRAQLNEYLTDALAAWRGEDPSQLPGSFKREVQQFLETVRRETGLLLARGEGLFGFAHLTFQEYFVARQITRKPADAADMIRQRLKEPRWREPLLLAVAQVAKEARGELQGLLDAALTANIEHDDLLHHRLLFVASAFPECAWVPRAVARKVCSELIDVLTESHRSGRLRALRDRITTAYGPLRGSNVHLVAENQLIEALDHSESARRIAVASLITASDWYTGRLLESVLGLLGRSPRPELFPLLAGFERKARRLFDEQSNPLCLAAERHPDRWVQLVAEPAVLDLVLLLCANTLLKGVDDVSIRHHLSWDPPVSPLLLAALSARRPVEALRSACRRSWSAGDDLAGWAGFILRLLGETLPEGKDRHYELLAESIELTIFRCARWYSRFDHYSVRQLMQLLPDEFMGDTSLPLEALLRIASREFDGIEPAFASLLRRLLEGPDSVSCEDLDAVLSPSAGAEALVCFVLRALARVRLARDVRAGPIRAFPVGHRRVLGQKPTLSIPRAKSLIASLYSEDDEERERAKIELRNAIQPLSNLDAELPMVLSSEYLSAAESTHPLRGFVVTILASTMAEIPHDRPGVMSAWLERGGGADAESAVVRNCISHCGTFSDDVYRVILDDLLMLEPTVQDEALRGLLLSWTRTPPMLKILREEELSGIFPRIFSRHRTMPFESLHKLLDCPALSIVAELEHQTGTVMEQLIRSWESTQDAPFCTRVIFAAGLGIAAGKASVRAGEMDALRRLDVLGKAVELAVAEVSDLGRLGDALADALRNLGGSIDDMGHDDVARRIIAHVGAHAGGVPDVARFIQAWIGGERGMLDSAAMLDSVGKARDLLWEEAKSPDSESTLVGYLGLLLLEAYSSRGEDALDWADRLYDVWSQAPMEPVAQARLVTAAQVPGYLWEPPKERLAALGCRIFVETPLTMGVLVGSLSQTTYWAQRNALYGQLAELATRNPSFLNRERSPNLDAILAAGCVDPESWNCRTFAIRALARLRHLDRKTSSVLLYLCRDDVTVREATLEEIHSFLTFDDGVPTDLFPVLTGSSARAAATVAAILAALGTKSRTNAELRGKITSALAHACAHPLSSRMIDHRTLGEHCHRALLEMTG